MNMKLSITFEYSILSMDYKLLALTIGPGLAIAIYVFWHDKFDPEPRALLIKAFFWGCISIIPAILLNYLLKYVLGVELDGTLYQTFLFAFFVVAIAEESSKFFFLRWRLYTRPEFDEPYDGITYSVMIAMGFATLENILYVYSAQDSYSVALLRAFTAVPAHATFAIAMGYFTGLAKFHPQQKFSYLLKGLLLAVFMHGLYDFFLMQQSFPQIASGAFLSLIISVYYSIKAIKLHQKISPFNHNR